MINKISVIMPVYNTEQYVSRAIWSVLKQDYMNWELLIIDDGSTDGSATICKKFADSDDRIILLHQNNAGQGVARNLALSKCNGNFVMFLDSDDWIDSDCMSFLLRNIIAYNADVVECGCRDVSEDGTIDKYQTADLIIMNASECIEHLPNDNAVGPGACSKLFTRAIIGHKTFPSIRAFEDYLFIYDICSDVNRYVHIYEPKWNYYHRANSTMTSKFSLRSVALIDAQKGIYEILKNKNFNQQSLIVQKILCSKQFYILSKLLNSKSLSGAKEEALRIKEDILSSYNEYMNNPHMGMNKIMLMLIKFTPSFVWNTILKFKFS